MLRRVLIRLGVSLESSLEMSEIIGKEFLLNQVLNILPKFRQLDDSSLKAASYELVKLIELKDQSKAGKQIPLLKKEIGIWNYEIILQRLLQGYYLQMIS